MALIDWTLTVLAALYPVGIGLAYMLGWQHSRLTAAELVVAEIRAAREQHDQTWVFVELPSRLRSKKHSTISRGQS